METSTKKEYFDYLDALRCLAFLAVFYAHTGTIYLGATISDAFPLGIWKKFTVYGSYGVNFFFVLSGFLITYLLVKEKAARGSISIKNFYVKRILRIWPVYFITILFSAFILPFLIPSETYKVLGMTDPTMSTRTFSYFFFFLGNFYQGLGLGMGPLSIGILWSVAVEEQFYLVWPWIVKWLNLRKLALFTGLLIALSLLYKFIWADDRVANYYLPWSVGMDLAFGALLGVLYYKKKIKEIIWGAIGIFGISFLIVASAYPLGKNVLIEMLRLFKTPLIDCVFVLLLLFFLQKIPKIYSDRNLLHISRKKLKNFFIYLGKISYGLYAYHTICLMLVVSFMYRSGFMALEVSRSIFFVIAVLALALTILVANFSSVYIERKFLALKDRLKS